MRGQCHRDYFHRAGLEGDIIYQPNVGYAMLEIGLECQFFYCIGRMSGGLGGELMGLLEMAFRFFFR